MKNLKKYFKGFTLVELIIVITILAILATIAFVSFQSYTKDARDANRTATIKNIEKGLELFTIKTGNFPTPDEPTTFTGGLDGKVKISQGIVWDGVATIINMNTTPLDPNDKSKYTYSTFWDDNKYYQVAINAENYQTSFIPQTYAFTPKSAIVQWNYRFDPSLPSLIVVPGSVNTASWIFDPKVCFVIDGWKNSLDNCVEKKEEMSLKDFDSSLVGYWDMETTSWSLLKDLSGNGNHWSWIWDILPTDIWWHLWKWYYFSSWALLVWSDLDNIKFDKQFTLTIISNAYSFNNSHYPRLFENRHFSSHYENHLWVSWVNYSVQWMNSVWIEIRSSTWWTLNYNYATLLNWITWTGTAKAFTNTRYNNLISLNKFYYITFIFDNNIIKTYVNWIKKDEVKAPLFDFVKFNTDSAEKYIYIWWRGGRDRDFHWIIDEAKIYNRALTDEEIRQQAKIAGF